MNIAIEYKQERLRTAEGKFSEVYPFASTKLSRKFLFAIEKDDEDYALEYSRLRAAAYAYFKRTRRKFQCRQVEGGIEVKRIM